MIQIYTGDGKGKTTAALGLALRASGAGLSVYIGQFLKTGGTSEAACLAERFPNVTLACYGGGFVIGAPTENQKARAQAGLAAARAAMGSGRYGLVILDEAVVAVKLGLMEEGALLALMDACSLEMELVLTGRGAGPALVDRADLVTEMRCIKHYYQAGVQARRGIEL